MLEYLFSQNAHPNLLPHMDKMDFLYHINIFDWPVEHGHKDYWEFTIVTHGAINNRTNDTTNTYEANTLFVATPKNIHRLLASGVKSIRYINIMVKESYLKDTVNGISPHLLEYLSSENFTATLSHEKVSEIEQILLQVNYSALEQYEENNRLVCSAFLLILSAILLEHATASVNVHPYLVTLNQLAQNNELLKYNVNDLCRKLGYSRVQLNATFKRHYGITPHEYLIDYKFNHAQKLLMNTTMTVSEISEIIGYATPMQFYTAFKRLYGITPAQYRKSHTATK